LALLALALSSSCVLAQPAGPSPKEAAVTEATDSYKAALQSAGEAMKKFDDYVAGIDTKSPDPQVVAGNITSAIDKHFADETKEASKTFNDRLSELEGANASALDEKVRVALKAADEVKSVGELKVHEAHDLFAKMRKESKEDVRKEAGEVKKLALKAKKAARVVEKAKKHAGGEKGEKEAEHEFLRNEKVTEGMEKDAEHKRDQAEHKVQKYTGRVEHDVKKLSDSIMHDAKNESESMRHSVLEAQAKVLAAAKAEQAKKAAAAEEKAEAANKTAEEKSKPAEKDASKQKSAPKDDKEAGSKLDDGEKPADNTSDAAPVVDSSSPVASVDEDQTAPVEGAYTSASNTDVAEAAPVNGASIPVASPVPVFLAQLVFVVVGASVAGLIPNLRRRGSLREPALLG